MKKFVLTLLFLLFTVPAFAHVATAPRGEVDYGSGWCLQQGGIGYQPFEAIGGLRVDCVTETHIVEVAFAPSWAVALKKAQDLSASTVWFLQPGVVLILLHEEDQAYLDQLKNSAPPDVTIWTIDGQNLSF